MDKGTKKKKEKKNNKNTKNTSIEIREFKNRQAL